MRFPLTPSRAVLHERLQDGSDNMESKNSGLCHQKSLVVMNYSSEANTSVYPSDSCCVLSSSPFSFSFPYLRKGNIVHATSTGDSSRKCLCSNLTEAIRRTSTEHFTPGSPSSRRSPGHMQVEQSRQRRLAANERERRRMMRINIAFDRLRMRLQPSSPHRLSKHDTVQMALSYILELSSLLEDSRTAVVTKSSCKSVDIYCQGQHC